MTIKLILRKPRLKAGEVLTSAHNPVYETDLGQMPVFPQKLERIASYARAWKIDPGLRAGYPKKD
jgi:hypothetical protein